MWLFGSACKERKKKNRRNDGSPTCGPSPDHSFDAAQIIFSSAVDFVGNAGGTSDLSFPISIHDFVSFPHLCTVIMYVHTAIQTLRESLRNPVPIQPSIVQLRTVSVLPTFFAESIPLLTTGKDGRSQDDRHQQFYEIQPHTCTH